MLFVVSLPSTVTVSPFEFVTVCSCDEELTYSPSGFLSFAEQPATVIAIVDASAREMIAFVFFF